MEANSTPDSIDSDRDIADRAVTDLLVEIVGIDAERVADFGEDSQLFGALPEFDSMAVAQFLTAFEERVGVLIEDDDVEAEDFLTYGRLIAMGRRLALR